MLNIALALVCLPLAVMLARAARRASAGEHARALAHRVRWKLPAAPRARLAHALADADVQLAPEQAIELSAGVLAASALLAAAMTPVLVAPVVVGGVIAAVVALRLARGRRERRVELALPAALELIAAHLRAGGTVVEGVAALADGDSPLAADLGRVRVRTELGLDLSGALAIWPAERPLPDVRAAAGALAVASSLGGRSADALDSLARSLRERQGAVAEAVALSAQARLSALVVGLGPIGFLCFSAIVDPSSTKVLFATGVGRACLLVGISCEALGAWWMHRIVTAEP
jgi:tight adherence protein B